MKLTIWIHPEGTGGYVAECPELPGAEAHGATWDETLEQMEEELRETFAAHVEQAIAAARRDLDEPPSPQPVSLEFAFVAAEGNEGGGNYATVA